MWFIYALGGGWGHLTRAAALARAAIPRYPVGILTNSPHAGVVQTAMPELGIVTLDPALSAPEARRAALREISAAQPDCLIVDTFPRGLGGELASILPRFDAKKVLVHRDLNPRYAAAANLREFVAGHYHLVLAPGEGEAFTAVATPPWLIREYEEIGAAMPQAGTILVCASGRPDELDWYAEAALALEARGARVRLIDRHWPAMDLFATAGAVVGGGGYNTVYECLALAVPLIARAWPRKYDRQAVRLERAAQQGIVARVDTPEQAAAAAMRLARARGAPLPFDNGVRLAVESIAARL
jgi:predicted glycosyltransferase